MDQQDQPIGVVGREYDITEKKRVESLLLKCENSYEAAILASGNVLYDRDVHTNEVTYAGNLERMLGYRYEEMAGPLERWLEIVHPDDISLFKQEVERVTTGNKPYCFEYRIRRKDGGCVVVQDKGHFVFSPSGQIHL